MPAPLPACSLAPRLMLFATIIPPIHLCYAACLLTPHCWLHPATNPAELNMRYLRPLRSGDRFRGTCRVTKATGARLVFEQQLWLLPARSSGAGHSGSSSSEGKQNQLVMTAEAVVVSLDSSYKPKRLSSRLREVLLAGAPAAGDGPAMQLQELL